MATFTDFTEGQKAYIIRTDVLPLRVSQCTVVEGIKRDYPEKYGSDCKYMWVKMRKTKDEKTRHPIRCIEHTTASEPFTFLKEGCSFVFSTKESAEKCLAKKSFVAWNRILRIKKRNPIAAKSLLKCLKDELVDYKNQEQFVITLF